MAAGWRFYVYCLFSADGSLAYVGKGSGRRLKSQCNSKNLHGEEVARFKREKDAYQFERELIAAERPALNRHAGGNGSTVTPKIRRRYSWEIEMGRIGTRAYAARGLLRYWWALDPSKVEEIRRVAYG